MELKTGCCGFAVSQQQYFRLFKAVEIQQTFYKLPRLQTAEKWRAAAPPGFEFAIKAWQLITHEPSSPTYRRLGRKIAPPLAERYGGFRATREVLEAWEQTAAFARALGARLVVFQCPASFTPAEGNVAAMYAFFWRIDRKGFRFIWEPRGAWPEEMVRKLCRELDLVHGVDPFKQESLHGEFQYFRLHGITGYGHKFTDQNLRKLAGWARRKSSYVMFNNKSMREDALRFLELL